MSWEEEIGLDAITRAAVDIAWVQYARDELNLDLTAVPILRDLILENPSSHREPRILPPGWYWVWDKEGRRHVVEDPHPYASKFLNIRGPTKRQMQRFYQDDELTCPLGFNSHEHRIFSGELQENQREVATRNQVLHVHTDDVVEGQIFEPLWLECEHGTRWWMPHPWVNWDFVSEHTMPH